MTVGVERQRSREADADGPPPRTLGVTDGVAVFVGLIVGSGVFFAPSAVASVTSSYLGSLLFWVLGGSVALCGAVVYAACAAHIPENGGFYAFYRQAFGPRLAATTGFAGALVTYPASLAILATVFADYVSPTPALHRLIAVGAIIAATLVNVAGMRSSRLSQRLLTGLKVLVILGLAVAAVIGSAGAAAVAVDGPVSLPPLSAAALLRFSGVMVAVFWAFSGWSDITLVAGEIRDPGRKLTAIVLVGVAIVTFLYIAIQWSVLYLLGPAAGSSSRVLADAVAKTFGPQSAWGMGAAVALSVFGALSALSLVVSRLLVSMASDGWLPGVLARIHTRRRTPVVALGAMAVLSCVYVAAGFDFLIAYFTFAVWPFYGLAAIALVVMRRRQGQAVGVFLGLAIAVIVLVAVGMEVSIVANPQQREHIGWGVAGFLLLAGVAMRRRGPLPDG